MRDERDLRFDRETGDGADEEQLEGAAVEQAVNYNVNFMKALPGNDAALHSRGSEETLTTLTGVREIYRVDDVVYSVILQNFDGMLAPDGVPLDFATYRKRSRFS